MSEGGAQLAESTRESEDSLLGPGDPEPCEVLRAGSEVPLMFLCDHASRAIPAALDNLGLDETVLCRHVAWDIGAADLARRLADRFAATLVLCGFSRLVIDPNRQLDDPTSIPVISDGVVIPGNRELAPEEARMRARSCFRPYHDAIEAALAAYAAQGIAPAVVSVHSFTPVFKGHERPWHVGILWNEDSRMAKPLMQILGADSGLLIGDNQPYSGRDKYGYTVETHAEARGLPHVLIEVRQDLIDTRHGADAWAARLGDALEACLARSPDLLRPSSRD